MKDSTTNSSACFWVPAGLWFLAFPLLLQLLSSIYFLNLATTGLNPTAGFMGAFLLAWLAPLFHRVVRPLSPMLPAVLFAAFACLALLWPVPPLIRIVLSVAGLFFLMLYLLRDPETAGNPQGLIAGSGLYAMLLLAGDTYRPGPIPNAIVTASAAFLWLLAVLRAAQAAKPAEAEVPEPVPLPAGIFIPVLAGFAIFALFQLFQFPGTAQAWTGLPLPLVGVLILAAGLLSIWPAFQSVAWRVPAPAWFLIAALAACDLAYFRKLPALSFAAALLAVYEALQVAVTRVRASRISSSVAYGLPATLFMLLCFAWIFTITYDQAKLLGSEYFRDRAPLLLVLVVCSASLAIPFRRKRNEPAQRIPFAGAAVLILAGISGAGLSWLRAPEPAAEATRTLRVITYNIYQGFDPNGFDNRERLSGFLRSEHPQLVGLQESDTTHPSSCNGNIVEWLARRERFYSFFGPHPSLGSYGVSTLSTLPILGSGVTAITSIGEQVHMVQTRHRFQEREFTFLVTHFGLSDEDHVLQTEETIRMVKALKGPVILAGDFNLDSRVPFDRKLRRQLVESTGLIDVQAPDGYDAPGVVFPVTHESGSAIDTVFVSPQFRVVHTEVRPGIGASDHYPVVTDLQWR